MDSAKQNFRVQQWITGLSVVLFAAKIIAWYLTQSVAILSDALESIVNVLAGFIGLYSLYVAAKPSDTEHPYGHGKAEFISAAAEGSLIIAAGFLILYETLQNYFQQRMPEQLDLGLYVIAVTAVINYIAGHICKSIGKKNNSLALQASGKHLQIDTFSTLVIIAALVIMLFTGVLLLDKIVALVMSFIIMYNGYKIIRRSLAGIMDEADMELLNRMVALLNKNKSPDWIDMHNLRVIKYGSVLHIDCHLTLPWYMNIHEAHLEIDKLTALIKAEFGDAIEMFVHTDGCLDFSCHICNKTDCPVRQHSFKERVEWTLENVILNKKHRLQ